ncbi:hypothetical protein QBC46DRAFT_300827 [Diplogelasinospora grovesii]|uniref:Uncharacterized protein n=1 Tax=Diplogelasinospora grovesii TaxID=303347 RepID=A0AAN6MVK4_9PEZI|nr:hypothetical protein QBC46DRAFT_300827 [Diplogelasinospora grovesii]
MCIFHVRVANCGHYKTTLSKPCKSAKKNQEACDPDNSSSNESTTGEQTCGLVGCDSKAGGKREGPGSRTNGGFDNAEVDWDDF